MHRDSFLQLLRGYEKRYPDENEVVTRFREFVTENTDCFERSLAIGHITGSAWIVSEAGDETLLTHHRKLDIWVQTGGHADGESDVLAVARQEAEEEAGLKSIEVVSPEIFDLDIHRIPARKSDPEHFHYDVRFAFRQTGDRNYIVSEESHDLAWVPLAELEKYTTEESMLRMRDKSASFIQGE